MRQATWLQQRNRREAGTAAVGRARSAADAATADLTVVRAQVQLLQAEVRAAFCFEVPDVLLLTAGALQIDTRCRSLVGLM